MVRSFFFFFFILREDVFVFTVSILSYSLKLGQIPIVKKAYLCDGLEIPGEVLNISQFDSNQYIELSLTPFKIVNVRLVFH